MWQLVHVPEGLIPGVNGVPLPVGIMGWIEHPYVKWAVPIPLLIALAPWIWLLFRSTWRELESEALAARKLLAEAGKIDYRPIFALALGAVILTLQEYYGGRVTYDAVVRPFLTEYEGNHPGGIVKLAKYEELYALSWWAATRMGGYILPLVLWVIVFRRDRILDFGMRTTGFFEHAWIYAFFVAVMIPVMRIVAKNPDFGTYYPFYRNSIRSWMDFGMWEVLYIGQFFCLEIFFRGWWVRAARGFGVGAIFSMVVPYCMIHFGKPYLEACGAIVAGTVLGSLSMKTRSIWAGFLVHITVAILMDLLALDRRHALPTFITPDGTKTFVFTQLHLVFWVVWGAAILLLALTAVRRRKAISAGAHGFFATLARPPRLAGPYVLMVLGVVVGLLGAHVLKTSPLGRWALLSVLGATFGFSGVLWLVVRWVEPADTRLSRG